MHRLSEITAEAPATGWRADGEAQSNELAGKEHYLALELHGRRWDIGLKYGLLTAQLALAFDGKGQLYEVFSNLVEMLAVPGRMTNV